ncbi:MAG: ammonium transporter [Halobacteriales archaeon]
MTGLLPFQSAGALATGINNVWVLVVCFLIFFMQPGFAMLEAGQVRAKNVGNVLMKNLNDWVMGVIVFFIVGAGVTGLAGMATASSAAVDFGSAFAHLSDTAASGWIGWFFGAVFAMTAATIVSGAVAGRMKFSAYVLFAAFMTAIIYPVLPGFAWGGIGLLAGPGADNPGFLGEAIGAGYLDFAGATIVHMAGGIAGLVAAKMVGPRKGRYDENGNAQPIPGHSILFAVLGTLILAFGWYGFNVGTQATIVSVADDGSVAFMGAALGRVVLVTTLGMGGGGVAAMAVSAIWQGKPDPLWTANGLLAGLVGVTGAVPHVTWWGGLLIGLIVGALVLPTFRWTVDSLKIDDVCGVFAVHGGAGGIGTILIPFLAAGSGGGWTILGGSQILMQVVGVLVVGTWTVLASMVALGIIDALVGLRVSEEEEERGLDISEHGISTYPEFGTDSGAVSADGGTAITDPGEVRADGGTSPAMGDDDE